MKRFRYITAAAIAFSMFSLAGCSGNASNNLRGAVDGYGTGGYYSDYGYGYGNETGMDGYGIRYNTGYGTTGYNTGYGTDGYTTNYEMGSQGQYNTANYYDGGLGTGAGYESDWNTSAGYWNEGVPGSYGMGTTNDGVVDTNTTVNHTATTADSTANENWSRIPFLNSAADTTNS